MCDTLFRYHEHDSDDDAALINQLERIEQQDNKYKDKIMQQNQEDLQKANVVKAQRKIQESIVYQRMIIQKNLTLANQFPQHDQLPLFEESKREKVDELKSAIKSNLTTLNEI